MIVRKIHPWEWKRTGELFSAAFEVPYEETRDAMVAFEEAKGSPKSREDAYLLDKYAAFEDDGETMTSCLSAIRYPIQFDGNSVWMTAIGGVSSLPHFRNQGGIRGCFEALLPDLYREGILFSFLYPFSFAYYRKFGYEAGLRAITYECRLNYLPAAGGRGKCLLVDRQNRDMLLKAIKKVYENWQNAYNGMVENETWEYRFVTEADPYKKQEFTYVYFDEAEEPCGYMTFTKERDGWTQKLICSRFVFTDAEGLLGLLGLARSMKADHESILFTLPETPDIGAMLPEWAFGALKKQEKNLGMVRVINAEQVLAKARYRGSGQLSLLLTDEQIAENNGVFTVQYRDGRAVTVEKNIVLPENADVSMPIGDFSRGMLGCLESSALAYVPGIKVRKETALQRLSDVFYKKPGFLMEYF